MASKIRQDDEVIVLAGREKGKRGKVKCILRSERVVVKGINLVKKHQKPVPSMNQPGSIVSKEASLHISNVAFFNETVGKSDRIGFKFKQGKKFVFLNEPEKLLSKLE